MNDPKQPQRGFFDPIPAAQAPAQRGFLDQNLAPAAAAVAQVGAPTVAPIELFAPAVPPKRKKRPAKPAGTSTWVVALPAIVFLIVVAPANPAFGVLVVGISALLTGLYTLVTGRPSWARIATRKIAVAPVILAVALMTLSAYLPSSLVVAPKFLTAVPVPTAAQTTALSKGFERIDARFSTDWDEPRLLTKADDVCRNDFASQTPEQEISGIQEHMTFTTKTVLTPAQARAVLDVVRTSYCGEPGDRELTVKSELQYSVPDLWSLITALVNPAPAAAPAP
jgi:hypothetical protein